MMTKSEVTRARIEEALDRILNKATTIVPFSQKLSVKSVEEEAGLGSGSIYYYKDIVEKIRVYKNEQCSNSLLSDNSSDAHSKLRLRLKKEIQLKRKYRADVNELRNRLSDMASQHNSFALTIEEYKRRVAELEYQLESNKS
ncbi:MAG: hypothetical protein CL591_11905 [Alteromonas sp.]|nr:hypothetical protein [Alteromonas sp.]|tara:strand:+ start:3544 stop:3969 length:426 start_codon:yes stop_codon:yes gene_type:complete